MGSQVTGESWFVPQMHGSGACISVRTHTILWLIVNRVISEYKGETPLLERGKLICSTGFSIMVTAEAR